MVKLEEIREAETDRALEHMAIELDVCVAKQDMPQMVEWLKPFVAMVFDAGVKYGRQADERERQP